MEAPIAVKRDHGFAIAREVKGLGMGTGRDRQSGEGERSEKPESGTNGHKQIASEAGKKRGLMLTQQAACVQRELLER